LSDQLLSVLGLNHWLIHSVVGMSVPIYQGGALQAQVRIATAQEERSIAYFGGVALGAMDEVEVALTNERLLAQRLPHLESAVSDHTEAVRVANLRYKAGTYGLPLRSAAAGGTDSEPGSSHRAAQLPTRQCINLHLALGGSFDSSAATASSVTTTGNPP
jgi:hypothetical protein